MDFNMTPNPTPLLESAPNMYVYSKQFQKSKVNKSKAYEKLFSYN